MGTDAIARARLDALDRRLTDQGAAQDRANGIALTAAEKAVLKAENASERRFEAVNEFRQTLSDQAATFIRRSEVEAMFAGKAAGNESLWRVALTIVGLLIAASTLFLALTRES